MEIVTALARHIPIIPVLVHGATMPSSHNLPDVLEKLSRYQAYEITDIRWKYDVKKMIAMLEQIVGVPNPQFGEVCCLEGHTEVVFSVAFSSLGDCCVSASIDQTIICWDVKNGQELQRLQGFSHGLTCAALSPDGHRILCGSIDGMIRLLDLASGKQILSIQVDSTRNSLFLSKIYALAFSPDGRYAISGGEKVLKSIKLLQMASITPYYDAILTPARLLSDTQGIVQLWDLESGMEVKRYEGPKTWRQKTTVKNCSLFSNSRKGENPSNHHDIPIGFS